MIKVITDIHWLQKSYTTNLCFYIVATDLTTGKSKR
jgi:hypothetical protein